VAVKREIIEKQQREFYI